MPAACLSAENTNQQRNSEFSFTLSWSKISFTVHFKRFGGKKMQLGFFFFSSLWKVFMCVNTLETIVLCAKLHAFIYPFSELLNLFRDGRYRSLSRGLGRKSGTNLGSTHRRARTFSETRYGINLGSPISLYIFSSG